jgi:CheY-like chemotaxis protein
LRIEPQRLRLQAIVYNCVSILTGNAIRKNITITIEIADHIYVQADERLLTQSILNLLSNAIKFSFESGTIEIIASVYDEQQIEVVVRDHGVGMDADDQAKLFKVEKVISHEGTKGEKGSGFGLALVKEIVKKHGGDVWFYSEKGKGSEFHFTIGLPSNIVMFIMEQGPDRDMIIGVLNSCFPEFTLVYAGNGFEAVSAIAEQAPNVIIADHGMPLMSGIQLIQALRQGENDLKIPVIIILADSDKEIEAEYYQLGVKYVFVKPMLPDETERIIRSILI